MRSRTIREGSVGLLILLGLGLFGLMIIWIRGLNPGNRSYRFVVEFSNVGGMRAGAPVRYRGVTVGKITAIAPGPNMVDVEVEITPANLLIPRDAIIEANQAGLIGETSVDITPNQGLSSDVATNPLAADCQNSAIICDGDRLEGLVGVNFNELISATVRLTNLVTDPEFFGEIRSLARNTSDAAAGVATLSREVTRLTRTADRELTTLSASATSTTRSVGLAADRLGLTATEINSLLAANRVTLVSTLDNLNVASGQLQVLLSQFSTTLDNGEFIANLETLSANAAQASTNLRVLSESVGSRDNLLLLQQTLDSARATFENAQKITADLDELTGDPEFRQNIRDLVNGLSTLVSSTQQLEQQTELARRLAPTAMQGSASNGAIAQNPQQPADIAPRTYTLQDQLAPLSPERRVRLQPYRVTNAAEQE